MDFDQFYESYHRASVASKEIKLACLVEKILIVLSLQRDGYVKMTELCQYFEESTNVNTSKHSKALFLAFNANIGQETLVSNIVHFLRAILECSDCVDEDCEQDFHTKFFEVWMKN